MILDTSFIIDLFRNNESAVKKAKELKIRNIPLATTTVNVFELWQGAYDIKNKEVRDKILAFLSPTGLFVLDLASAQEGGVIYSELRNKGEMIDPEDCMIAGIVKTSNKTLLTKNKKHFDRIRDLKVETY